MDNAVILVARILLALIFVVTGLGLLGDWQQSAVGYMHARDLPAMLLPLVGALQIAAGLAIIVGVLTRWVALALALFCVLTALLFHLQLGQEAEAALFMRDIAMAGGLLLLYVHGAGAYSVDARFGEEGGAAPAKT